jgi:hypothetical protein
VARATQKRSRATPFVRFCSATFFCARKNDSHFSLSGAKKRQLQPERYMPFGLKSKQFIDKKHIDIIFYM